MAKSDRTMIFATLARHDWNMQATVYCEGYKWFVVVRFIEGAGSEKPPREFASQLEAVEFAKTVLGL